MKFTDGYWLTRPEYKLDYAMEAYRVMAEDKALRIIAAARRIGADRGATLNTAAFEITISSPLENVLSVELVHFAGAKARKPRFALADEQYPVAFDESDDCWSVTSGRLRAEVTKKDWSITYFDGERRLTSSADHAIAHALDSRSGKTYMMDSLYMDVGEWIYGLGERFGAYLKNGQTVDIWNADGGTASEQAYKNIPFYMTNRGYGVLVDDTSDVSFEVGSEKVERVQFSVEGEALRYYMILGPSPKEVLCRYTQLVGRPALPPAWSFGLWLSTSFTTDYDEKTTTSFIDGMKERDIPLSVFHFDCFWMKGMNWCDFEWDRQTFPDPKGMLARYKSRGLHISAWINPYVSQFSPLFAIGKEKGYFIQKENGDVWQTDLWQPGMAILDVTNPQAREWFSSYLERLLDMGVDCLKTDFGERIPVKGVRYFNGSSPLHMHNYYTHLYNQMVFELLERKRGKGDAVLFARSATAGGQQYPVHWGGDNSANYRSMAETLRAGLSLAHCGFGFWSHDISGFEQTAPADVYKRWAQFGLLSSHSRLHGSSSYRVPWLFDEEACEVVRRFAKLKCRLMPYLYSIAVEAHEKGIPMLRPMLLEFPDDLTAQMLDRQYMLGDKLLVAPVFSADEAAFYLPAGRWINILDEKVYEGERWVHERYDFMHMPLLVREDTVLPMGAHEDRPDYDYADQLELHVYGLKDGERREIQIHDLSGRVKARYTISRKTGKLHASTDSALPYRIVEHTL